MARAGARAPWWAAATLLLVTAASAAAPSTADRAREETKQGGAAFALGQYDEARQHYERAYRLVPSEASLLFNLGQCYRLGGQPGKALTAYRSYLRAVDPKVANRSMVERIVADLEAAMSVASPPPPRPPAVLPSPATSRGLGASPGLASPPSAVAPLVVSPAPERPYHKRGLFWCAVGVTVAAGVGAALLLGRRPQDPIRGDVDPGVVVVR